RFMQELKTRNIGVGLHYTAAHEFSYYASGFGWRPEDYPEAHFVSERIVSLPLFPGMTDADQDDVVAAVSEVLKEVARWKSRSSCRFSTRRPTWRSSCAG